MEMSEIFMFSLCKSVKISKKPEETLDKYRISVECDDYRICVLFIDFRVSTRNWEKMTITESNFQLGLH